jgi:hypothetical protein
MTAVDPHYLCTCHPPRCPGASLFFPQCSFAPCRRHCCHCCARLRRENVHPMFIHFYACISALQTEHLPPSESATQVDPPGSSQIVSLFLFSLEATRTHYKYLSVITIDIPRDQSAWMVLVITFVGCKLRLGDLTGERCPAARML